MPEPVITLASTTSSQAELDHAASGNWREPFIAEKTEGTEPSTEGKSETESETVTPEQQQNKPETKPESSTNGKGWQKRVDRLTARNKSIETENATLRARLDAIEARQTVSNGSDRSTVADPKPAPRNEPKLADYATPEEWFDARDEWRRTEERRRQESTASDAEIRQAWDAHNSRISEARARYDDFDEVAGSANIPIPESAALAIIEQPNSADITYYLATHPEEAKKLATLRPIAQIAAIVKISEKPEVNGRAAAPKPKPASQAPQPIKPVGGAATGSTTDLGSMSYQDYKRARANGRR